MTDIILLSIYGGSIVGCFAGYLFRAMDSQTARMIGTGGSTFLWLLLSPASLVLNSVMTLMAVWELFTRKSDRV